MALLAVLVAAGAAVYWFELRPAAFIVGRWQNAENAADWIDFAADGTFRVPSLLTSGQGRYELLDGAKVRLTTPGLLWGSNQTVFDYKLVGSTIEVSDQYQRMTYVRSTGRP